MPKFNNFDTDTATLLLVKTIDQTFWTTNKLYNVLRVWLYNGQFKLNPNSLRSHPDKKVNPPPSPGSMHMNKQKTNFKKYVHPRNGRSDAQQAGQQTWVDAVTVSGADSRKTRESAREQMRGTQPVSWRSKGNLRGFLYNWSRVSHFLLSVSRFGVWCMTCVRKNRSPNQTLADLGEGLQPPPLVGQFYPRKVNFGYF